jgi:hypothetical protein
MLSIPPAIVPPDQLAVFDQLFVSLAVIHVPLVWASASDGRASAKANTLNACQRHWPERVMPVKGICLVFILFSGG